MKIIQIFITISFPFILSCSGSDNSEHGNEHGPGTHEHGVNSASDLQKDEFRQEEFKVEEEHRHMADSILHEHNNSNNQ